MSIAHIRLTRTTRSDESATYLVESPDFNSDRTWEEVGNLEIDINKATYRFIPSDIWKKNKILPPEVFGLEPSERDKVIEEKFKDSGYGMWSGIIHHYANFFLANKDFPANYPPFFFAKNKEEQKAMRKSAV